MSFLCMIQSQQTLTVGSNRPIPALCTRRIGHQSVVSLMLLEHLVYCTSHISDLISYHVKQGCWIGLKVVLFRSSDLVWAFLWSAWGILRDCRCSSESEECRKKEKMEGKVKTEPRAVQAVS